VEVCRDLDGAQRSLQRAAYELVILNLLDAGDAALRACREMRRIRREQRIAFIRGRWTEIPQQACPHYLIPLPESPRQLLAKVAKILEQEPEPPRSGWELAGGHLNS
jgi:DNA-binding response OmpR family regulator